jgi:hypothetical protein
MILKGMRNERHNNVRLDFLYYVVCVVCLIDQGCIMNREMCNNCKFWEQDLDRGKCRRFPPLHWFVGGKWEQPTTNFNQWCGEYKQNESSRKS